MTFMDLGEIALAWYRASNPTPRQQALANERLAICETCEYKQVSALFDYTCGACGCPLHKKIFTSEGATSPCPKGKWPR